LAAAPASSRPDPVIGTPLILGSTGPNQRAVIQPDGVGAALVAGTWKPPREGEQVTLPDGKGAKAWTAASIDDKGLIKSGGLSGGYAYVPVDTSAEGVYILEASAHGMVYVNGEPRTGDPYDNGSTHLPILLHAGRNDLLFKAGRGDHIRLALRKPSARVQVDPIDPTLPDLLHGQAGEVLAGLMVVNATTEWQPAWLLNTQVESGRITSVKVDPLAPLSTRKIAVSLDIPAGLTGPQATLHAGLARSRSEAPTQATLSMEVRKSDQRRKITFRSAIDGSVQYYALRQAAPADGSPIEGLPLILTLHGAGVEAAGQCDVYQPKPWCNIVAPNNRRPYGFDWEDWGRLDAIEALEHASAVLKPDPGRIYLTGHSMGGHGTWQIGAHLAPRFAAIAPSAGWISFASYVDTAAYDSSTPVEKILRRAASPSDTLTLKDNYRFLGIYILHGEADDNVSVEQARRMRGVLGEFHPDFAYYERPGAGHWWGNDCEDWPPLMEFLQRHSRGAPTRVRFTTASPGVSSVCDWATVVQQIEPLRPSTIDLRFNAEPPSTPQPEQRSRTGSTPPPTVARAAIAGSTTNVAALCIDPAALPFPPPAEGATRPSVRAVSLTLDDQKLPEQALSPGQRLWLVRDGASWTVVPTVAASAKNPARCGSFKSVFTNNMLLVVGTGGSHEENAECLARARYDAETFWYRGNGSLPIILDSEFDAAKTKDRNVVLYGNAHTNRAWSVLLGDSPVQVSPGAISVGGRSISGDGLACLLIRPRPGSDIASVGAVAATDAAGLRLSSRVPYFSSGVGLPDWIIIGPEAMRQGAEGVRAGGFFANDWSLSETDSAWSGR
jgi:dienelactone hydrolase